MIAATVLVLGLNVVAAEPKLPSPKPLGATYKKSLDTAAKNFEAEREAAKYKYLKEIQNVLTKAMQEGDLDAANQINELKKLVEKDEIDSPKPKSITANRPLPKTLGVALPGWKPMRASPGANLNDPHWGGMVVGAKWLEWQVLIPAKGEWYVYAFCASREDDPRPCHITIQNKKYEDEILAETTTGYHLRDAKWFRYGPYPFDRGTNRIRIESSTDWDTPHLRGLYLTPDPNWTSDGDEVLHQKVVKPGR
jgi:hypothetical protein